MLFNSYEFLLLFLPLTLAAFFGLQRLGGVRSATLSLVAASLFFYAWWNPIYLPLILGSIAVNHALGRRLAVQAGTARGKRLLGLAIAANLILLGYYKYSDFFLATANQALGTQIPLLHTVLPLGISFFTFTQIAFLVDAWRGEVAEYSPLHYALFVSYFPHLLAGPILHHKEMMPQFDAAANRRPRAENLALGLFLLAIGLAKKVLVADRLAEWANAGFSHPQGQQFFEAWFTSLAYSGQLYFDFSGYSDMAVGLSLLFNIRLPDNFNSPYKAVDIQDFWRRWHMTLSRFLRDYVYIPLGGNRGAEAAVHRNLIATFAIGGLWHGAGWTFVVWGLLHGLAISLHRAWKRLGGQLPRLPAWILTFLFADVAWVFFRAKTLDDAFALLQGMAGLNGIVVSRPLAKLAQRLAGVQLPGGDWLPNASSAEAGLLIASLVLVFRFPNSIELAQRFRPRTANAVGASALLAASLLALGHVTEFLYFNF